MRRKICGDCDAGNPVHSKGGKSCGRCLTCHRARNREEIRARRRLKKVAMLVTNDESTGWKVCAKCLTNKRLSEYSPSKHRRCQEVLNKLCDACLTAVYLSDSRRSVGFDEVWWRKKAYTCNTAGRQALAKRRGVKVSRISLSDLDYVCKPQDIIGIFAAQGGLCHYCTHPLLPGATSVDHATPLDRGGAHEPANFRVACYDCNLLKWSRTEEEFWEFIPSYAARFAGRASSPIYAS